MKTVDLGNAKIDVLEDDIILFTAKEGVVVDKSSAERFYEELEKYVDGDYSLIINRENNYQLLRVEVFNVINNRSRLKTMAVVANKDIVNKMAKMEEPLCKKPFAVFYSVEEAVEWIRTQK